MNSPPTRTLPSARRVIAFTVSPGPPDRTEGRDLAPADVVRSSPSPPHGLQRLVVLTVADDYTQKAPSANLLASRQLFANHRQLVAALNSNRDRTQPPSPARQALAPPAPRLHRVTRHHQCDRSHPISALRLDCGCRLCPALASITLGESGWWRPVGSVLWADCVELVEVQVADDFCTPAHRQLGPAQ